MSVDLINRLTDNQRAYLRLVLAHQSSKEIAQHFGVSAHTVDKRIKEAMRVLGVGSRIEAARVLAQTETPRTELSAAPDLADPRPLAEGGLAGEAHIIARIPLPLPLFTEPARELSLLQRAGWMIGLIIGLAIATGILLSGLTALSTLIVALRH